LRDVDFRDDVPDDLREDLREDLRDGTLAPFSRASLRPIAIACLRLVTRRPELLLSVPRFRRRIVDSTFLDADLPYFAMRDLLLSRCAANAVLKKHPASRQRTATGATVDPVPPWIFSGCTISANS
jgi:hypothetical protein